MRCNLCPQMSRVRPLICAKDKFQISKLRRDLKKLWQAFAIGHHRRGHGIRQPVQQRISLLLLGILLLGGAYALVLQIR